MFEISINQEQRRRVNAMLAAVPKNAPRALSQALRRTRDTAVTRIVRGIGQELNLPRATIASFVKGKEIPTGALEARIKISRKPIPLIRFGAQPAGGGGGVRVKVSKTKGAETHPHWFIATMPTGHIGVFTRSRQGGQSRRVTRTKNGRTYSSQLPIREIMGPTPLGVFQSKPGLAEGLLKDIGDVLQKNINSQIDRFTKSP